MGNGTVTVTMCGEQQETVVTLCTKGHKAVSVVFSLFASSSGASALAEERRLEVRYPRSNLSSALSVTTSANWLGGIGNAKFLECDGQR